MSRIEKSESVSVLDHIIRICLSNRLLVLALAVLLLITGLRNAPFDWHLGWLPRDPVPVDAIPDIGENQQIVFSEWPGQSPQDVEDQITYPLTVSLLGIPGVKSIRSYSMFGFSTIYIIFEDDIEFYWSRSRILEKLNSLPPGTLPVNVSPMLGPDATALGQIYWYTLEGLDADGQPTGGWSLEELRSVQDWFVRYALMTAKGVAEVASVGGFVKEYQVDVDPDALQVYNIALNDVFKAVRQSNQDVGARTIEINRAEYVVRGLGFIQSIDDLEETVVRTVNNVPVRIRDIGTVTLGPALRRGVLDKQGAEVVGGVAVARFGENPLATLQHLKKVIHEIEPGLPEKVIIHYDMISPQAVAAFAEQHGFQAFSEPGVADQHAWQQWMRNTPTEQHPEWASLSKIHIVPFYDRSGLIQETLNTLNTALIQQVLITVIVIMIMVRMLRASLLISGLMPLAILGTFIAMRRFGVDANVVALSGIAIAIGTMVDMGIVISENILRHRADAPAGTPIVPLVYHATREVAGAVITAVATTVAGFLPVFALQAAEGKLFKPLAYTKTFALIASALLAITVLPVIASFCLHRKRHSKSSNPWKLARKIFQPLEKLAKKIPIIGKTLPASKVHPTAHHASSWLLAVLLIVVLALYWLPLGPEQGSTRNVLLVGLLIAVLLGIFSLFRLLYTRMLRWCLNHKLLFLMLPIIVTTLGASIWMGWDRLFGWLPDPIRKQSAYVRAAHLFPGMEKEFMPRLDEGSFISMPTTMPHASIGEAMDMLSKLDRAISALPEVEEAVGKAGRAESPLDPAPVSMFEILINYKPPYLLDEKGHRQTFRFDPDRTDLFRDRDGQPVAAPDGKPYHVAGQFMRDEDNRLIPDRSGQPFRLWRPALDPALNPGRDDWPGIQTPDDIWNEIVRVSRIPGVTSSPKLQPIETRIVMLQSGMRAPMGVKVRGPDSATIEKVSLEIERILKQIPAVRADTVLADRIVGKPYLEIDIDRTAIARYGLQIQDVQRIIQTAIGGSMVSMTVEGRERYPIRIRYPRERRDSPDALERILVPTPAGHPVPLGQLASIRYVRGPQVLKSEDTFQVGYVTFDKQPHLGEVDVVEQCQDVLRERIASGDLHIPPGVSYTFAGSYQNQVRAAKTLAVIVPFTLLIIFMILYLQFHAIAPTLMVFSGIFVAWSGGFLMLWLYGQPWFLSGELFGIPLQQLFQVQRYNLSVAVWVGFLALFGIATDDGVLMGTVLTQEFKRRKPSSIREIRDATIAAAALRIRPALLTSATTILALLPVLTSTGRGSDIMVPMAIPTFGGMLIALLTVFVVPVLFCLHREYKR